MKSLRFEIISENYLSGGSNPYCSKTFGIFTNSNYISFLFSEVGVTYKVSFYKILAKIHKLN